MLSRQIVRASALRLAARPAARLPLVQHRTFLPDAVTGREIINEKYPDSDYPELTDKEDPGMVGVPTERRPRPRARGVLASRGSRGLAGSERWLTILACAERRLREPPSHQAPVP